MTGSEPDDFAELSPSTWDLVEGRVGAFEAAWVRGDRPALADFLLRPDPTAGQLLVELVYADLEFRCDRGETVEVDDYLRAFPQLRERPEVLAGLADAARHGGRPGSAVRRRASVPTAGDRLGSLVSMFEAAWTSGPRPRIEDYIGDTAEPDRTTLFERLLKAEVGRRRREGETPRPDEYQPRFPQYAERFAGAAWGSYAADVDARPDGCGTRLGHFELVARLGAGGFGTVWKARDTSLDRLVALKILHPRHLLDGDDRSLVREARSAARLRHHGIVRLHDARVEGDRSYLVYDYVEGVSLRQRLAAGRPTPREAADLCAKIADAVHYAHGQGVVHRDLKPGNVLIDAAGEPHVMDFGMAKRAAASDAGTRDGQVIGSLPYLSPEQAAGRSNEADARTDVYGLGMILYELLTGRPPFEGRTEAVLHRVLTEDPAAPRRLCRDVARDLETVCLKAIAKTPGRRYASAADFAADLRRFLAGVPIAARRTPAWERAWKRLRRQPTLASAPVAVAVSLAAVLFWGRPAAPPGTRLVSIATDPPDAEMRFVPLDAVTGEPQPEKMIDPGRSPVTEYPLAPGDYLVVAALELEPGERERRFHEVYRSVPAATDSVPYFSRARLWTKTGPNSVRLTEVVIPPASVTDRMARLEGGSAFEMGIDGSPSFPAHRRKVPAFFIDAAEFTVGDWKRASDFGLAPLNLRRDSPPDDQAVGDVTFDRAETFAEKAGKRLPTETEFEFAATHEGTRRFPWGNDPLPAEAVRPGRDRSVPAAFGGVRALPGDRLNVAPPVHGLCTGLAEWTQSRPTFYPGQRPPHTPPALSGSVDDRVVRGGGRDMWEDPAKADQMRDPRLRYFAWRGTAKPGLGFRCVRSAEPRLKPEDFEAVLVPDR